MSKKERLLEWVAKVPDGVLESQIVASGMSRTLDELLLDCKVDMKPHPTVKDRHGWPVMTVILKGERDGR